MNLPVPVPSTNPDLQRAIQEALENWNSYFRLGNLDGDYLLWANGRLSLKALAIKNLTYTVQPGEDIQAAIDQVYADGGGVVQLLDGTYSPTADLTLYSGVYLQGVGFDSLIDFGNAAFGIKVQGTLVHNAGTIAINDGSSTVTGSGTTFTAAMVGNHIYIQGAAYEILTFTSTTSIDIDGPYYGPNLSGQSYVIADTVHNVRINQLAVANSGTTVITCQYVSGELELLFTNVYTSVAGISLDYCSIPLLTVLVYGTSGGEGVAISNCSSVTIEQSSVATVTGGSALKLTNVVNSAVHNAEFSDASVDGINATGCSNIGFENLAISRNTGQGIEFVSTCTDIQVSQTNCEGNGSDGIKSTGASNARIVVDDCALNTNGGYGINNAAGTGNIIGANTYSSNTSGTYTDSGTSTVILASQSGTETLKNKTFDNTNTVTLKDTNFTLQDDGDTTKQAVFDASSIGTGTTKTITLPNASGTMALIAASQTFQNKTITNANNVLGGVTMTLGSDATADMYYRSASGVLTRVGAPTTQTPKPVGVSTAIGTAAFATNTTQTLGLIDLTHPMTVNNISIDVTAVGTAGTLDLTLYSEDGQTRHVSTTTASIAGTGIVTTAVSPAVVLPPGNYYLGVNPNGTANVTIRMFTLQNVALLNPSGEPVMAGTQTITAGTPATTFTNTAPTSGIACPWFRFD
jgi:hypothetical protein